MSNVKQAPTETSAHVYGETEGCSREMNAVSKRAISGYIAFKVPGHPRAHIRIGYVFEHVLIAEKALGRFLSPNHPVHHVDDNRTNNANTNLVICEDQHYHLLLHSRTRTLKNGGDPTTQKVCSVCDAVKLYEDFNRSPRSTDGRRCECRDCQKKINARRYCSDRKQAKELAKAELILLPAYTFLEID